MKSFEIKKSKRINTSNALFEGEELVEKLRRVITINEAIETISPIIYTERKDGILPEYDINTDKWDIAQKGMELVSINKLKKREEYLKSLENDISDGTESAE